jgi:cell division protein FtsQ
MTDSRNKASFTAYTGATDIPLDFAPIRAEIRGAVRQDAETELPGHKPHGGLRVWLLLLLLIIACVFALRQHSGVLVAGVEQTKMMLSQVNLPQISAPSINRAINTVRLESALNRVTEQEVRTLLARYTESGFLGVDVQDLRAELELNPWIAQATVRRVWPDVLVIRIVEEEPFARWHADSLVNRDGRVFAAQLRNPELQLPRLSGPDGTALLVMESYERFSAILQRTDLAISSLDLSERGSWIIGTHDGPQLYLGRDGMDARLTRFAGMYVKGLREHLADARTIDLRYSNGISVSRTSDGAGSVARR